ncbi:MAG: PDGLE domain-containing protein [Chloroflexota bacterium]
MKKNIKWWYIALGVALLLALAAPLVSSSPDGLERVAEDSGFLEHARDALFNLIPDYTFPGVSNPALATIAAGLLGTLLMFGIGFGLARLLRKKNETQLHR